MKNTVKKFVFNTELLLLVILFLVVFASIGIYFYQKKATFICELTQNQLINDLQGANRVIEEMEKENTQDSTDQQEQETTDGTGEPTSESGSLTNEKATDYLKKNLGITMTIPNGWDIDYSTSKYKDPNNDKKEIYTYYLNMSNDGLRITISNDFSRGDICGFDAGNKADSDCFSRTFLKTSLGTFTEFVVKGRTKEIIFIDPSNDKSSILAILVTSGSYLDEQGLDTQEEALVREILKSIKKI